MGLGQFHNGGDQVVQFRNLLLAQKGFQLVLRLLPVDAGPGKGFLSLHAELKTAAAALAGSGHNLPARFKRFQVAYQ